MEKKIAAAAPFSSLARCARMSPTWSSIPLTRLRDHSELLHTGAIHHVEHRHHPPVRYSLVRFEQRPLDAPRPQHRTERRLQARRSGGDAVEIDRTACRNLNLRRIVRRQL